MTSAEETPFATPDRSPELRRNENEPEPRITTSISVTDCDNIDSSLSNNDTREDDDVVCANEISRDEAVNETVNTEADETERDGNNTNAQDDADDNVQASQDTVDNGNVQQQTENNGNDLNDETTNEARIEQPVIEDTLTFDENHFSTPTGGVSPERSPRTRRRRTTTSSMEDSEVRKRMDGAAGCDEPIKRLIVTKAIKLILEQNYK